MNRPEDAGKAPVPVPPDPANRGNHAAVAVLDSMVWICQVCGEGTVLLDGTALHVSDPWEPPRHNHPRTEPCTPGCPLYVQEA